MSDSNCLRTLVQAYALVTHTHMPTDTSEQECYQSEFEAPAAAGSMPVIVLALDRYAVQFSL